MPGNYFYANGEFRSISTYFQHMSKKLAGILAGTFGENTWKKYILLSWSNIYFKKNENHQKIKLWYFLVFPVNTRFFHFIEGFCKGCLRKINREFFLIFYFFTFCFVTHAVRKAWSPWTVSKHSPCNINISSVPSPTEKRRHNFSIFP